MKRDPSAVVIQPSRPAPIDWMPVWLILPAGIIMAGLLFYPIVRGIALSFFNTRLLRYSEGQFIGLANYVALGSDPAFSNSVTVTFTYGIVTMLCTYCLGLGFALLLNRKMPGRGFIRTLFIMPWAIPEVVAVMIFVWMLDAQYGVINYVLVEAGILSAPAAWLTSAGLAMPALVLVTSWQQFPFAMLILLAGLQTIPDEQYEAAMVDGAGVFRRFIHVTLPGLRAVNVILILILILNSFRRVTMIYAMTGGGPARATETLSILTYNVAFQYQRIGYASAVGAVLLVILLCFSLVYFFLIARRSETP
ncbi:MULTISPECIES: sugar ABC transporter permease [unclassified Chelatococcus]|uniref:carbohydrate ABC transporter permease n=1 Tax=unclassified Chelatococcus TaxID=2638111 RepID=UPI001BCE41D5|nr:MULTISPECIES: sugar ABC transporter permease [unclassified Chelatococcus]MBS7699313.1 sugar ABC transporter permease [Chelatococcus sp. YT9]MBX3557555.1 sugar ABC transporter permease [Chelatococcus sp.]